MNKNSRYKGLLFILVSIFLIITFYKPIVLSNFLIHREYIIKSLCVQKDNQIDCYGKCQLKKMLKNTSDEDHLLNDLKNLERLFEIDFFLQNIVQFKKNQLIDDEICVVVYNKHIVRPVLEVKTPPPQMIS